MSKRGHKNLFMKVFILFLLIGLTIVVYIVSNKFHDSNDINNKTGYSDYKLFEQAVSLVDTDMDKALELCRKSRKMAGECFVNIARIVSEKNTEEGIQVCEAVSNTAWKDECRMAVAEHSFGKNLSLAAETCNKAGRFRLDCYHNMGIFIGQTMGVNEAVLACNGVQAIFKNDCFLGFGVGRYFREGINASSDCGKIPLDFSDVCYFGVAAGIGFSFKGNVSFSMQDCIKLPIEARTKCFRELFREVSSFFKGDINSSISACNEYPAELRGACLQSLSLDKGRIGDVSLCNKFENPYSLFCSFSFGIKEGITFSKEKTVQCGNIADEKLKPWCYRGFGRGLGERFSDNVSLAVSICNSSSSGGYNFDCYSGIVDSIANLFSEIDSFSVLDKCGRAGRFSPYCFERVGKKSVEVYNYNLSKSFNMCYEVNEHFRGSCFTGIGKGLGETFLTNSSFASMKCNELPSPYNIHCHQGLDEIIEFYNVSS